MSEEIFRITKDKVRARNIYETAIERYGLVRIIPKDKTFKFVEEYYECIKELLTSIMYLDGFKTLSHIKLIEYFSHNYKVLNQSEIRLIDELRRIRHGIMYYGEKVKEDFVTNHEQKINEVLKNLFALTNDKLEEARI